MNLIEHLIQEDAISSQSKRSTLASEILRKKITTTVVIYPQMLSAEAGTSALIRQALRAPPEKRYIDALNSPKHKAELVKLAAGKDADFEVLSQIEIFWIDVVIDTREKITPVSRSDAHEANIIAVLKDLNYTPTELPKQKTGKPWVKSEVKKKLASLPEAAFKKAWQRLRDNGEIAEKA